MESMKMEIPVVAPIKGTLKAILVQEGQDVSEGQELAVIES
jgi:biotin carboxyl carrier protein